MSKRHHTRDGSIALPKDCNAGIGASATQSGGRHRPNWIWPSGSVEDESLWVPFELRGSAFSVWSCTVVDNPKDASAIYAAAVATA